MFRVTSVKLSRRPRITRHLAFLVRPASARKTLISVRSVSNEHHARCAGLNGFLRRSSLRERPCFLPVCSLSPDRLASSRGNVPSGRRNEGHEQLLLSPARVPRYLFSRSPRDCWIHGRRAWRVAGGLSGLARHGSHPLANTMSSHFRQQCLLLVLRGFRRKFDESFDY